MSEIYRRLIEVALPIREISAESVRDKSLRHGHASTLHVWWARRPLAACRAIVFASLVPDPDDPACPSAFRRAVERLLKTEVPEALKTYRRGRKQEPDKDPYRPYDGVPDTLRHRLLMFVAKWSPEMLAFEAGRRKLPEAKLRLDDRCLVKWEVTDPDNDQGREVLRVARELVQAACGGRAPRVLDPFAGGGSIPLEAARLGCEAIANDYNPVAHLILRATCEFPQRFGMPKRASKSDKDSHPRLPGMGAERASRVLVEDVVRWARRILDRAKERIGHLYPPGSDGRPVVGYLWARTVPCTNPSCRGEIPLLKSLLVCNKDGKRVALTLDVDTDKKTVTFGIAKGEAEEETKEETKKRTKGTVRQGGDVRCPFCGEVTKVEDVRAAGVAGRIGERMVAVITSGKGGKDYRAVEEGDLEAFHAASQIQVERPGEMIRPEVTQADERVSNRGDITVHLYGMRTWGSLFNPRQLVAMQTFVDALHEALGELRREIEDEEYRTAVAIYLALWVSRNAARMTTVGRWNTSRETMETPFESARLAMKWDYPEANPFSDTTGGFENQLDWIERFLQREGRSGKPATVLRGDGACLQLEDDFVDVVVTDPPYFDEVAYADLSDFFYVWLKRCLAGVVPDLWVTPLAPKADEATALKHQHRGDGEAADRHFRTKLADVFVEARRVCRADGVMTVVFAHQETQAWAALIDALFSAGMTIDATWPIEMELKNRLRGIGSAALESSIVVVCRERVAGSAGSFRRVRKEVQEVVRESVQRFWNYGFRGADLIVSCYGPAVGVFGRYERVEKGDGTPVGIAELLDLARQAARDAIAGEFRGDPVSTLYYLWANLYGTSEQSWDDARLVVQVGGEADAMELARGHGVFVIEGPKCRLALLEDRARRRDLGEDADGPLIDALHRALLLWKAEDRASLRDYLRERGLLEDGPLWKLAQALFEVLPRNVEDWKLIGALLGEVPTFRREARQDAVEGSGTYPGAVPQDRP